MALRIQTNVSSLNALTNLDTTDRLQSRTLERLATGLRINRASDDPSGFVASEKLNAQVKSLDQAIENSLNASNLIGTAEASLHEVSNLLVGVRESIIFALNSNSSEQIAAEQDSVDNAIAAIDRIAQTTRFADRKLLDGTSSIRTASSLGSGIRGIQVDSAQFAGVSAITLSLDLTAVASRAGDVFSSGATGVAFRSATAATTLRVTGAKGTVDVSLASGTGSAGFGSAINAFTGMTGVYASAGELFSVDFGSDQTVSVEVVSGSFTAGAATTINNATGVLLDAGVDAAATLNGAGVFADGNDIRIVSKFFTGNISLNDAATTSSNLTFKIQKSGLVFQLNTEDDVTNRVRIGISNTSAATLGSNTRTIPSQGGGTLTVQGFLSRLKSGDTNDLTTDSENALRIVDEAINQVTGTRAFFGAFQKQTLESNIASLTIASEDLSASLSDIRDLDFAKETSELTRTRILFQAGTSVLAQANQLPQAVLSLLR